MTSAFRRLWAAQSASDFGSYLSLVALPLVAVVQLDASATQMGLLVGAGTAPLAFAWPLFGVLADRVDRRRIMVVSYLGRALLFGWIPVGAAAGVLTIGQLVAVWFLANLLKVAFDVAHPSVVPAVVGPAALVRANSRLESTRSLAMVAGPAAAGLLVDALRPTGVMAFEAVACLLAGLLVRTVRTPASAPRRAGLVHDLREGVTAVFGHPVLRPMAISTALLNAFFALRMPLFALFVVAELGFSASRLGLILAAAGPGALIGSLAAPRIAARWGFGRTTTGAAFAAGAPVLAVPLVHGSGIGAMATLMASAFAVGCGAQVYNVTLIAGRQAITPDHLLGRVTATFRWAAWAATPFAAAGGGLIAAAVGVRGAIAVAGLGLLLPGLCLLASGLPARPELTTVPANLGQPAS